MNGFQGLRWYHFLLSRTSRPIMPIHSMKSRTLVLLGVFLSGLVAGCGSSSPIVGRDVERRVYLVEGQTIDRAPEIVGGYEEIERRKSYPAAAEEDDAYGVIWLQGTISARGAATRLQIAEGGHPALETEAMNIIQRLDFRPATRNGAPVRARVQIPVIFQGPYAVPEEEKENGED